MSFFTIETFQKYSQEVQESMASKVQLNSTSPVHSISKADIKLNEKQPLNKKTTTRSLSVEATRKLDPLSSLNLARNANPWLENSLLTPTACNYLDHAEDASASAVAAMSLKLVDDYNTEEDWGDFVKSGSHDENVKQQVIRRESLLRRSTPACEGSLNQLDNLKCGDGEDRNITYDWPHDRSSSPMRGVNSPSTVIRNNTPTHAESNLQVRSSPRNEDSKGFTTTLLSRLLSLGSLSPRFGFTHSNSSRAMERNYDSYDVTFDRGPVGLKLETDWYGRQAVVKGFRAINAIGDEGAAKRCGLIRVGDVLTAINGESCLEMDFQETLELLRLAGKSRHTLHFKSLEAAGDLSIYASDKDLVQARAFIHQHKQRFYRPPVAHKNANPHELILGCIERLRGEFVTAFNFHLEETGEFLLAASCLSDGSGPFIFHNLRDSHLRTMRDLPQSEDSAVYLGRLEPSFLGIDFTLFDHHTGSTSQHNHELAYIVYDANILGRIPNSLKCIVSRPVDDDYDDTGFQSRTSMSLHEQRSGMGSDGAIFNTHQARLGRSASLVDRFNRQQQSRTMSITERLRSLTLDDIDLRLEMFSDNAHSWLDDDDAEGHSRSMRVKQNRLRGERAASMGQISYGAVEQQEYEKDLLVFSTKQPWWNEDLRAWTLNFQGRAKVASKKNFLLVGQESNENEDEEPGITLRFGKVSKTRFSLDYAAPLAPIQALAVACSAFANKRAVT
ncbi:atp-binding cassette superfamily [Plasmopara halstedii]|uniref:Atp-binding cassette superfamily n=1 Tax=Plasmopara halstedii TaxID=4781 RepID=A0A0N7L3C5_PLAHL|nr:atp-binding cassette superfamily [Plasmopara halstedii]CEG35491.1 atp-binding cassette superfamily [Plasmopara halstedii]|eukprot:XP_024571860.1 atp-binding cassette superfamily [Plasmopara halstedii]